MSPSGAPASLTDLADTLALERRLLEYLHFKLVAANLILTTSDAAPFVHLAIGEVEQVMRRVRQAESHRSRVVVGLARDWDVRVTDLSLEYIATRAPEPMRAAFADHRDGFMELVNDIERVTLENRRLATVNLDAIRDTLGIAAATEHGGTYDDSGRRAVAGHHAARLDQAI